MTATNMKIAISNTKVLALLVTLLLVLAVSAHAAAPGITGPVFSLTAQPAYLTQPDGQMIYSWGYGCKGSPAGYLPDPNPIGSTPVPGIKTNRFCNTMQVPGPTLIVKEGDTVTVTLTNNLPNAAGNTSILFPGFNVTATGGVAGLITQEAVPGGTVTYSFQATSPGTRAYYSGTQGDLQVEMGLYGAVIVLPATTPSACDPSVSTNETAKNLAAEASHGEYDLTLAHAAYDNPKTCYDREYLFQFSE